MMSGKGWMILAGWVVPVLFITGSVCADGLTEISFETADIGAGRWQYTYDVTNIALAQEIEEFTIWFEFGDYDNLAIETLDPPAANWDEIVWQPEPLIGDDGGYDARATDLNIGIGQTVSGFAVSFDWLGLGEPGTQFYQLVDPTTFDVLDAGWTIPEPATLSLMALGAFILTRKNC
ncbi:MAG: PEP-CTERM sorting domain-containing protein [Sedimentisphaerales bacterium]|nr:PEP-CTERM sorting domain-containing protein [Sedimentisphaerales bacterium]